MPAFRAADIREMYVNSAIRTLGVTSFVRVVDFVHSSGAFACETECFRFPLVATACISDVFGVPDDALFIMPAVSDLTGENRDSRLPSSAIACTTREQATRVVMGNIRELVMLVIPIQSVWVSPRAKLHLSQLSGFMRLSHSGNMTVRYFQAISSNFRRTYRAHSF